MGIEFSEEEAKWLLLYGKPSANSDIRIDDEEWKLDWVLIAMFDSLEKHTIFNRAEVERTFWKRITAMANYQTPAATQPIKDNNH